MNDGSRSRKRLRMVVEPQSRELSNSKLFAQNPLGVVALKNPILKTAFHAAGTFEQRSFCRFKKLLRAREKRFARVEKLQLVAKGLVSIGPGKFRGLKFAGGKVHEREANRRP